MLSSVSRNSVALEITACNMYDSWFQVHSSTETRTTPTTPWETSWSGMSKTPRSGICSILVREDSRGVYFSVWSPPPRGPGEGQKYGQITCWEKKLLKGGEMHIFSLIGKRMHIFSPIKLKYTKLPKKRLTIFQLRRAPPYYKKFHLGKKYQSRRGGGCGINMNFFNKHPWKTFSVGSFLVVGQLKKGGGVWILFWILCLIKKIIYCSVMWHALVTIKYL